LADDAEGRAEDDRVHGDAQRPRLLAAACGEILPPSLAPSETTSTAVGGMTPSLVRCRLATCAHSATASPRAVPPPGRSEASASWTRLRSAVGGTASVARLAKETTPTRNVFGTSFRNASAAPTAAA